MSPNVTRPSYSDEQRAAALARYVEVGPTAASKECGIPKGTITRWAKAAGLETVACENTAAATKAAQALWEERRAVMVHEIGGAAALALDQATLSLVGGRARDAKDYATTMAILVDKAQLLSGGATSRFGSDEQRQRALDEARERGLRLVGAA